MATPAAVLDILLTANTTQANAALAKTQAELNATSATAKRSAITMKGAMLGVGVAAVGAGVALYKIGEQFDKASDTIRVKTGATGRELGKLEQSFKNVVTKVPASFEDVSNALADVNQRLSIAGRPLEHLSKQFVQLSKITGTDVETNVRAVSRSFVDWEVKTKNMSKTLDGFYRLSQDTGISVSDIAESVQKFGSPLRQLGFDLDTAAALFANFEKAGVNTQTMVPGLKLALASLNAPTGEVEAQMKKFNITIGNAPKGLKEVFDILGNENLKAVDRISLAMAVFGRRAGADMKEAIEQGRFAVGDLLDTMKKGDDTISKAERSTRDFAEQWQLFKNQVMVGLEPIATRVFKTIGEGMKQLNLLLSGHGSFAEGIDDATDAMQRFWKESAIFRAAVHAIAAGTARTVAAVTSLFQHMFEVVRGTVKILSGVLTGHFGRAWDGVKDIFRGGIGGALDVFKTMTAPIREVASRIGKVLGNVFEGAWDHVKKVFESAKEPLHNVMDRIGGGITDVLRGIRNAFRGVAKVVRTVVRFIVNAVNRAVGALGSLKDKISDITPDINVPDITPWSGAAPWKEGGIVRGGTPGRDSVPSMLMPGEVVVKKSAVDKHGGPGIVNRLNFAAGGVVPAVSQAIKMMQGQFPGLSVTSTTGGGHAPGSYHYSGKAVDLAAGDSGYMNKAAAWVKSSGLYRSLLEGIHNPNLSVMNGKIFSGAGPFGAVWADHLDHIHLALDSLGKVAGGGMGQIPNLAKRISGKGPLAGIARGAATKLRKVANAYISKVSPPMGNEAMAGLGVKTGPIQAMARALVSKIWGPGQWPAFNSLEMSEAGWNPRALNASSGAAGLAQALPASKYPPGAWPYQGLNSAKLQLQWMMGYIGSRYGDPSNAWAFHQAHNWYGKGGDFIARRPQLIGVGDGGPERVSISPLGKGVPHVAVYINGDGAALIDDIEVMVDGKAADFAEYTMREGGRNRARSRQLPGHAGRV